MLEIEPVPTPIVTSLPSYRHTKAGQVWDTDQIYITDMGSKNFTFIMKTLDDPPVKLRENKPRVIKLGDIMKLGDVYATIAIAVSSTPLPSHFPLASLSYHDMSCTIRHRILLQPHLIVPY